MNGGPHSQGRRRFLGQISLTAGGLAVAGLAPASLLNTPGARVTCAVTAPDSCGDWTLDDMCTAYPPYAFRTPPAVPHTRPPDLDAAGADWHWVA